MRRSAGDRELTRVARPGALSRAARTSYEAESPEGQETTVRSQAGGYLPDILLLAGLCALFFWRDLAPGGDYRSFAAGDFTNQFYAFAAYEAARLHAGQLPLWNPYTFAGSPFQADIQSAIFYPLSLLTMLLTAGSGFTYRALQLEAVLHFPLAAVFTYLLARRLTGSLPGSRFGALVAAVTFTFSGYLTSYPPLQLAVLEVQAWLPLILLLLDIAAARSARNDWRGAYRWAAGAGLALGVSLLAGHPQSSLLVLYAALAFGLYRAWPGRGSSPSGRRWSGISRGQWGRVASLLALFVIVGGGLAAVQLLPSWQFMTLSTRSGIGFDEAGRGFTPYDLLQAVLPAVGVPFPALYVGILPLGLAALALVQSARGQLILQPSPGPSPQPAAGPGAGVRGSATAFLGWGALLALLLSFGKITPVYTLFYLLAPGWRLFREQERTIAWAVLAVSLLAGYGAAWLASCWESARQAPGNRVGLGLSRGYAAAGLGALGLALACFVGYQAGSQGLWGFTAASLFLALLAGLAALALYTRQPALLLALLVFDLFTQVGGNHAGPVFASGAWDPFPPQPVLAPAQADSSIFRIANESRLPANYGDVYGLADLGGASPLQLASYRALLDRLPPARAWSLLNVKYVVTSQAALDVPAERVAEATGSDGKPDYLYRLAQPGPRAWLAGEAVVEPDAGKMWQALADPAFDPQGQVLLPAMPQDYSSQPGCSGSVAWQTLTAERLALTVETDRPCILVLSEVDYPGWQAGIDGRSAAILRADGALRGMVVPAGQHAVTFEFRPPLLTLGAAISIATLLLALALLLWPQKAGRA